MTRLKERASKIYFANDGATFNGSFHLESVTISRNPMDVENSSRWKYRIKAVEDDEFDVARLSRGYATPASAAAALNTHFHPWARPRLWFIAACVLAYITFNAGWSRGNVAGASHEFENICGFSSQQSMKQMNRVIPGHDSETPANVQRYCLDVLMREDLLSTEQ